MPPYWFVLAFELPLPIAGVGALIPQAGSDEVQWRSTCSRSRSAPTLYEQPASAELGRRVAESFK
jgi:hypothetical protein